MLLFLYICQSRFLFFFILTFFATLYLIFIIFYLLNSSNLFLFNLKFFTMASSSKKSPIIPPMQVAVNKILVHKYHCECNIPSDCILEVIGSQFENWKKNPSILPLGSIVISELHLQNLRLPFSTFFHYFFVIHDIHPLQLSTNSIRTISRFVPLNLIKDLDLGLLDFHLCYVRVGSAKSSKYFLSPMKGWVCLSGIPSKDSNPKHYFL